MSRIWSNSTSALISKMCHNKTDKPSCIQDGLNSSAIRIAMTCTGSIAVCKRAATGTLCVSTIQVRKTHMCQGCRTSTKVSIVITTRFGITRTSTCTAYCTVVATVCNGVTTAGTVTTMCRINIRRRIITPFEARHLLMGKIGNLLFVKREFFRKLSFFHKISSGFVMKATYAITTARNANQYLTLFYEL